MRATIISIILLINCIVFNRIAFSQNIHDYFQHREIIEEDLEEVKRNEFWAFLKKNPIKAVLVVGCVEDDTDEFIHNMKDVEFFLRSKKVNVQTFYYPNSDWKDIKKAAQDAAIFVYSGHGSGEGIFPKNHVSNEQIVKDIRLRKNAIVVFNHVCFGAGSSASDLSDIGPEEAERRVSEYGKTFNKVGAACYYANNYGGSIPEFFKNFYAGKTFKQCYEQSVYTDNTIEKVDLWSVNPAYKIGISSSSNNKPSIISIYINKELIGKEKVMIERSYHIAFVSKLDYRLENLLLGK